MTFRSRIVPKTAALRTVDTGQGTRASIVVAIVAFAFLLRLHDFGNPIAGLDEQFYLLVGDRMQSGALPYVDIWDRKPAGLFLIYAALRVLPGDGILTYQIVATLCLAATGCVVAMIAQTIVPPMAALSAGLMVVLYGVLMGLGFGEAPIFYDLPVAVAAWLVLTRPHTVGRGITAMALAGVAITIKTNAVFEGVAFGLLLLHRDWREGVAVPHLLGRAVAYAAIGAAPTLAIAAYYAAIGHFAAFWFANVLSILHKSGGGSSNSIAALAACMILLAPMIVPALAELRGVPRGHRALLASWLLASIVAFVAIGFFQFHYALPMVAPLSILAARALKGRWATILCAALGLYALLGVVDNPGRTARDRADVAALAAILPPQVRTGCLFVYEGPVILYHLTRACLPGRYVFPGHFTDPAERDALERPSSVILRETLAHRPAVIVSVADLREGGAATQNDRILESALSKSYRFLGQRGIRLYGGRRVTAMVWVRREIGPR